MAKYIVTARILGTADAPEFVAGPFDRKVDAIRESKTHQEQIPDPRAGDIVFSVQRVEATP